MRLHHLSVSAFGPFADTQTVDFEELNDAGLFLLTGATGAGKSSLLDAVCFALYGTVPGGRGTKLLKSQHAPVEARPEVVLDFSVQGRRFEVRRTPEWTRPKRRGSGVTPQKAAASMTELVGGEHRLLSSRAAEVGVLVRDLMGMDAGQFVQVALLPQGQFQTFLHASSQDRHDVLQQLFRTDRFARIEDWVHDRSRLLHGEAERGRSTVQRLLDSVADRAASELPENLSGEALAASTARDEALPWVDALREDALACALGAEDTHLAARDRVVRAREGLARARQVHERVERRDTARAVRAELDTTEAHARAAAEELEADGRAARAEAVLALHANAEHELDAVRSSAVRATRALSTSPLARELVDDTPTAALLSTAADELQLSASRLRAVAPRVRLARESLARLREDGDALAAAAAEAAEVRRRSEQLPAELDQLTDALDDLVERAGRAEALQLSLTAARHRHAAAAQLLDAEQRVAILEEDRRQARDRAQDARGLVQDLVSRRLAGMAAELAGSLTDHQPCPVCGSAEHPQRAVNPEKPVTDADHESADRLLAEARAGLERVEEELHRERARRDGLQAASGGAGVEQARLEVEGFEAAALDADRARRARPGLERRIAERRAELADLATRASDTAATVSRLEQTLSTHADLLRGVVAEVRDMLGAGSLDEPAAEAAEATEDTEVVVRLADEVERRLRAVERARNLLLAARDAVTAVDQEAVRVADLGARMLATASELGFPSVADLERARLSADRRSRLEDLLARRAAAVARAEAMEEELRRGGDLERHADLDEAGAHPTARPAGPDDAAHARAAVTAAEAAVQAAEEESERAAREAHLCGDRVESLTRLRERLEEALVAWAPLRDESLRAASMSRLVRGQGGDNRLQMRLSAYVLATRLDQVVAAANERLGHMRDQRYLLRRTGRAERRGVQAGLGLEVVDQWTGDVRPPATLSGGETFVVSLALALGLADVVTHEAGGTEVETLFVDEGFGTLDADTLDDVMDRLDGLRAGGRTVGVVSHVSELRSRIPTQVLVDKGRTGSTVRVSTLVG